MLFEIHIPVPPLGHFIESFVYYRDFNPIHSIDRFLPDGNVNVVIDLTDHPKFIYHNETLKEIQACRHAWFSGMRNTYLSIPSGRDSEMFVINFHKGRSYPFVQIPLHELTDAVVDADLVFSPEIMNMREMLLSAKSVSEKFNTAERHLLKQFKHKLQVNPFIDFAVDHIVRSSSHNSMEHLVRKIGYSQKHLIHLFNKHVGLTPKSFLRIIRFQRAIAEIERSRDISWTTVACEAGYYDQAHFINDFRNFSGFTPRGYLDAKNDQLNYVPVL